MVKVKIELLEGNRTFLHFIGRNLIYRVLIILGLLVPVNNTCSKPHDFFLIRKIYFQHFPIK